MIDYLKDIVKNCSPFDPLRICKISGSADETTLLALDEVGTVVIRAKFHQPILDFVGVFGLLDLSKLNTLLNIPEYSEGATLTVRHGTRNGVSYLEGINFKNKTGDFENFYRFVSQAVVESKSASLRDLPTPPPAVAFVPTVQSIQRLRFQAQAHSGDDLITIQSNGDELKFKFGDVSSNEGSFVFHKFTDGTSRLKHPFMWHAKSLQSVLTLPGDKEISITEFLPSALLTVKVDSGLGVYEFKFPSQSK